MGVAVTMRPAESIPEQTPREAWEDLCELIREREREHAELHKEWRRALILFAHLHEETLVRAEAEYHASLEALAHSEALALEGTAMRALERVMDALIEFEVRAKRDPAGAARALCRWMDRLRGSAQEGRAA